MRRLFVAGNWKMNTLHESAVTLAREVAAQCAGDSSSIDVLVAPPYPYLLAVKQELSGSYVQLGAQDAYFESQGAYTGEVAVEMLQDVGCDYVILGHSERRHVMGETDELINKKVVASLDKGLKVILCVGELLEERESGRTEAVLDAQMSTGLSFIDAERMSDIVIAYEPVWAIGTGKTATPDQAETTHAYLRNWLVNRYSAELAESICIQYGGSVKPENALELLSQQNVDGALVGGASLSSESFGGILSAAREIAG